MTRREVLKRSAVGLGAALIVTKEAGAEEAEVLGSHCITTETPENTDDAWKVSKMVPLTDESFPNEESRKQFYELLRNPEAIERGDAIGSTVGDCPHRVWHLFTPAAVEDQRNKSVMIDLRAERRAKIHCAVHKTGGP